MQYRCNLDPIREEIEDLLVKERSRLGHGKVKATQPQPQPKLQFDGF